MPTTTTAQVIIPEVLADLVESKLGDRVTLMPLATMDNTLQGQPGDTLKFPAFRYVGKADEVAENVEITPTLLTSYTVEAKVKKYAKAVQITDEARLSGYGDPVGEAASQLAHAIDHAMDDALFDQLNLLPLGRVFPVSGLSAAAVADALALFGEDLDGPKVILVDAASFADLRNDSNFIRASDLGQRAIFSGVVGEIWGCQIVISNKIKTNTTLKEKRFPVVKPGALRLVNKQGTILEVEREPKFMRDTIFASKHCTAYLYDDSKALALSIPSGVQVLNGEDYGISTQPGATGKYKIVVPDNFIPMGCKLYYKVNTDATATFTFGTAVSGVTIWESSTKEMTASTNTFAHLVLVDADNKPIKSLSIPINKGE